MVLSKNKVLFLFVISAFLIVLNTGCTRKVKETSVLTLKIPSGMSSKISDFKYSEPMSMQSVSAQGEDEDDAEWNPGLNPSEISEFNCYMITVSGPESDMRRNTCMTTTGQNFQVGRWIGGVAAGTTLSLEVPSGAQREITVIGFKATSGACVDFKRYDVNKMSISQPHILGKVVKDLSPGTVAVTVPVSLSPQTLKLDDCGGPDFNMESSDMLYFGDAAPGANYTVSSSATYESLGGATYSVYSFDNEPVAPHEDATFIGTDSLPSGLNPGDEIMITNPAQSGEWLPVSGSPHTGPCGYRFWEGRYAFARVKAVSTSPLGVYIYKGTLMDKLNWNPDSKTFDPTLKAEINSRLYASTVANGSFCRLHISKVLHYWDLTLNTGATISSSKFDYNVTTGSGIIPIRVANDLTFNSASTISAEGHGFSARPGYHGDGVRGYSNMGCTGPYFTNTGNGGSCAPNDSSGNGAGGGGHGTLASNGGTSGPSGGNGGGGTQAGGYGVGEDCGDGSCFGSLSYKIFIGGGGGSSGDGIASIGGHGGGIVYLMAKNVVVKSGSVPMIKANGLAATDNATVNSQGAGGGGAGGSIYMGYRNLTYEGGNFLSIEARGGNGGEGMMADTSGGGGGGGGRIHIAGCAQSTTSVMSVVTAATGGLGGLFTGSGIGYNGGQGFEGSVYRQTLDCP